VQGEEPNDIGLAAAGGYRRLFWVVRTKDLSNEKKLRSCGLRPMSHPLDERVGPIVGRDQRPANGGTNTARQATAAVYPWLPWPDHDAIHTDDVTARLSTLDERVWPLTSGPSRMMQHDPGEVRPTNKRLADKPDSRMRPCGAAEREGDLGAVIRAWCRRRVPSMEAPRRETRVERLGISPVRFPPDTKAVWHLTHSRRPRTSAISSVRLATA
jgi:hypothetical protein